MDDGRGPRTTSEPDPAPARASWRRWSVVAAAVLVLGGAGMLGAAALGDGPPDQPDLVASSEASAPGVPANPSPSASPTSPATGSTAASPPSPAPAAVADPTTLTIPAIGVSSSLLHLGLADDGTIAVPQPGPDYDRAAWFTGSPRPGQVGPAVLEGHVDSAEEGPSVFYRIGDLEVGDTITVERADGTSVGFSVTGAQRYAKDDFPTLAVYGNTAGPELRLITCGGSFDAATGHYRDNTVVYARQV